MNDIKFYIPEDETIPTKLRLYVGDVYVEYERTEQGNFLFDVLLDDEDKAMDVAEKIVHQLKWDHDEPHHGYSWRTTTLEVIPQEERYKIGTKILWTYGVRDSY